MIDNIIFRLTPAISLIMLITSSIVMAYQGHIDIFVNGAIVFFVFFTSKVLLPKIIIMLFKPMIWFLSLKGKALNFKASLCIDMVSMSLYFALLGLMAFFAMKYSLILNMMDPQIGFGNEWQIIFILSFSVAPMLLDFYYRPLPDDGIKDYLAMQGLAHSILVSNLIICGLTIVFNGVNFAVLAIVIALNIMNVLWVALKEEYKDACELKRERSYEP